MDNGRKVCCRILSVDFPSLVHELRVMFKRDANIAVEGVVVVAGCHIDVVVIVE